MKFFELDKDKFSAVLQRIRIWGYDVCLEEFITEYYLEIKQDNMLRQFVLLHLDKLIVRLKDIIEMQLLEHINKFDFTNANAEKELRDLANDLGEKESKLLSINPEKLVEDNSEDIIDNEDTLQNIKDEILADLRKANPELETNNWI